MQDRRGTTDRRGSIAGASWSVVRVAAAALFVVVAAEASAQKNQSQVSQSQGPPNALQGFSQNRDQPVKIQADKLEVHDKDKVATFTGNVHVTQGDTEMRSKALTVFYEDNSKPGSSGAAAAKSAPSPAPSGPNDQQQIRRIEATGEVRVTQRDQNATGDNGTFDMRANTVTLTGNVVITRGKDIVRGQRLVVDLNTGVSQIVSPNGGQVETLIQAGPHGDMNPLSLQNRPARAN
jgi:lipopolysaccharide export system protein LptA